jgi:hypothetical protein
MAGMENLYTNAFPGTHGITVVVITATTSNNGERDDDSDLK